MIAAPRYWKITHIGAFIFCAWLLIGYQDSGFLQKALDGSLRANQKINYPVEHDVKAPNVFHTSEARFWDGRPSLGGIWVAYPEIDRPEQVIIRNGSNKKFVIGALFHHDKASPGPRLILGSEAAEALGISAGFPADLTLVPLRKRSISKNIPDQSGNAKGSAFRQTKISSPTPNSTLSVSTVASAKLVRFDLEEPFNQIGNFGVEQNAKNTAESLRQMAIVPIIKSYKRNNRTFWSVLVKPTNTAREKMTLFQKARRVGFKDAYAVTH